MKRVLNHRSLWAVLLPGLLLGGCGSEGPTPPDFDEEAAKERLFAITEAADMPPLPPSRAAVYDYYKLGILPDGFPGRHTDQGLVPHPIYGTYLILDYLNLKREHAAETIADAAIARMEDRDGMLLFHYEPEWGLGGPAIRYVSGLTQSHYLDQFSRLFQITGQPRFAEAAEAILKSLSTAVKDGGVLARLEHGDVIEESPDRPRDLVLNGWLTSIENLRRYAARIESPEAEDLIERNLKTLRKLLPLYDVPEVANSRYRLRGFAYLKMVFSEVSGQRILKTRLTIPGDGVFDVTQSYSDRWHMGYQKGIAPITEGVEVVDRRVQLNLVLSMLSSPLPNVLRFELESDSIGEVSFFIAEGDYTPMLTSMPTKEWHLLSTVPYTKGRQAISVDIPIGAIKRIVYPTNFLKRIAGGNFNSYHFIHVDRLQKFGDDFNDPILRETAERWRGYVEQWPTHPSYRDEPIEFERYNKP